MPRFEFLLEAQDGSGHFKSGQIESESESMARAVLELRELEAVTWRIDAGLARELCETYGVESVDDLPEAAPLDASDDEKAAFRALHVRHRSYLNRHRQEKPYKVKKLDEVEA